MFGRRYALFHRSYSYRRCEPLLLRSSYGQPHSSQWHFVQELCYQGQRRHLLSQPRLHARIQTVVSDARTCTAFPTSHAGNSNRLRGFERISTQDVHAAQDSFVSTADTLQATSISGFVFGLPAAVDQAETTSESCARRALARSRTNAEPR